jgi:hypothetical protein
MKKIKDHWSVQIMIGVRVRVYKFHTRKDTYYEGVVQEYVYRHGHLRIAVLADTWVVNHELEIIEPKVVMALANGSYIEGTTRRTNLVDPVDHFAAWELWYNSRMRKVAQWGDRLIVIGNPDDRYWTEDGYVLLRDPNEQTS